MVWGFGLGSGPKVETEPSGEVGEGFGKVGEWGPAGKAGLNAGHRVILIDSASGVFSQPARIASRALGL